MSDTRASGVTSIDEAFAYAEYHESINAFCNMNQEKREIVRFVRFSFGLCEYFTQCLFECQLNFPFLCITMHVSVNFHFRFYMLTILSSNESHD